MTAIEHVCAMQSHIEDTKGNSGEQGQLTMTNLRLMWVSDRSHRTNLCIGYNCIASLNIKEAGSRLRGQALLLIVCLHVMHLSHLIAPTLLLQTGWPICLSVCLLHNVS